jgi:3',5'-cyclic AMP phosphodiesterase CpdA
MNRSHRSRLLNGAWFLAIVALGPAACSLGTPGEEGSFRLAVVGDFGVGNSSEGDVSEAIREWVQASNADALVTTGDNVYPDGDPDEFDEAWEEPYGWVADEGLPIVSSLGNHDVRGGDGEQVMELLDMPAPWYRERFGDAELFVLDANQVDDAEQTEWLEDALQDSDAAWQIAVFHQPAYSCSKHGSTDEVVDEWVPLFEEHDVDLVLNGHDHNYQRFASNGVTYVVTGGGGAGLYDLEDCDDDHPERLAGEQEHHFVTVTGSRTELRITARDEDGDELDLATLPE